MSGIVENNILRSSGTVAVSAAGLSWSDTIITGSTATVEAGKGYWVNTTSNTCTITLPSSAEAGDQIVIIDYARTWGTNKIIIDSNGLNYQGNDDTYTVEYSTDGQSVNIVYSDATKGWIPLEDDVTAYEPVPPPTQKGIFPFGYSYVVATDSDVYYGTSNIVNESGVMQADVAAVGTAKAQGAGATYGFDKGIHAFGYSNSDSETTNISNLISNVGVVASDVTGVGTKRLELSAVSYGSGNALFAFGNSGSVTNLKNLVNSSGVVASDSSGVGTAAASRMECSYGGTGAGTAIITMGSAGKTNLVSNTGVIASDTTFSPTNRTQGAGCTFGDDKGIIGFGSGTGNSNIISNTGVMASDVSRVGLFRISLAACGYGGDKGIFAFGNFTDDPGGSGGSGVGRFGTAATNLVSNSGVIASDTTGASGVTGKTTEQACGFGN